MTDIEDLNQAEQKLRRYETDLMEARSLARELQHERDRLRLLLDLNNRVAADLDLRQVFQAISSELRRIFKCDFVGLIPPDGIGWMQGAIESAHRVVKEIRTLD